MLALEDSPNSGMVITVEDLSEAVAEPHHQFEYDRGLHEEVITISADNPFSLVQLPSPVLLINGNVQESMPEDNCWILHRATFCVVFDQEERVII